MEPAKLIAYGAIILLIVIGLSKLSRVLAPFLVIVYGLFVAPVVRSWYAFQDKYLMPAETLDTDDDALCHDDHQTNTDHQTDRQTDRAAAPSTGITYLRLNKTQYAIVKTLVEAGWSVGQIRGALKGDNNVLSKSIEQARQELQPADDGLPQFVKVGEREQYQRIDYTPLR